MTQDERTALIAERTELVRKRNLRKQSNTPHAAWMAKVDAMIEAIDAQLDTPEPQPETAEPVSVESLAGKTLGDPDASTTERRLAAKVLSDARDGAINYDDA